MWILLVLLAYVFGIVSAEEKRLQPMKKTPKDSSSCPTLEQSKADIDTVSTYHTLNFDITNKDGQFWNRDFEERYIISYLNYSQRPTLKVFVVPHSHNDPGWLETFEDYFEQKSKHIISNIVTKLYQFPNMTFVWNEVSFLSAWWETALPTEREKLKNLVREGRLEITTGGWVMADEACTHIYALIDQFIEGHTWVKMHLGIIPKTGWSIDPFGHGPTVPYLLDQSGFKGSVIQRVHYAWKRWLAQKQIEEFYWMSGWKTKKPSMVIHHQPFSLYNIVSSCGPHRSVCANFDFSYGSLNVMDIPTLSEELVGEYGRIGSLTPHNVVLVPLGDDFQYQYLDDFDNQYINYMKIFNYINSHKELFNADVQFGTPNEFFNTISKRHKNIPTLKGDFFVYADVSNNLNSAYWSGYYTTRPYAKILARQLEHHLRTAEILFTFAKQLENSTLRANEFYGWLINARQNLGLFQHHDGITGTSVESVMTASMSQLSANVEQCAHVQEAALHALMLPRTAPVDAVSTLLQSDTYRSTLINTHISFTGHHQIIVFNPLTERRTDIITVRVDTARIRIYDEQMRHIQYQISPIILYYDRSKQWNISDSVFDLIFVASVPALSTRTYTLEEYFGTSNNGFIYCNNSFKSNMFITKQLVFPIRLENSLLKLTFDRYTGLLQQIYRKDIRKKHRVSLHFGAYESKIYESGAYLFKRKDIPEINVLHAYTGVHQESNIIVVSGPVYTEITTLYLPFLVHTVRIFNVEHSVLARAVHVETEVDYESPPKNRDTELFMRIQTDIQNGDVPEFYTDQNGFQYQKRVKVGKLGIEANYYPITTMAWLQDQETRLTLITNHAQGAAAFEPGHLEVMLDRRIEFDDKRGLGEGVLDNRPVSLYHWIILESMPISADGYQSTSGMSSTQYEVPSQAADYLSRTLNYPLNIYLLNSNKLHKQQVKSPLQLVKYFPPGIHLVTLRTIPEDPPDQGPSKAAYLVLQRPGYSCNVGHPLTSKSVTFTNKTRFVGPYITNITSVSLTGLRTYNHHVDMGEIHLEPMELKTYQLTFL